MKDTKQNLTIILFSVFCIAVSLSGCSDGLGGSGTDGSGSLLYSVDYIKAKPSKFVFGITDPYIPAQHLKVYGVFGGVEDEVPIGNVTIKVISDPGFSSERTDPVTDNQSGILFEGEGPKTVVITYNNMEDSYGIAVGVAGIGGDGWGTVGPDDGLGIIIMWDNEPWPPK